MNTKEISDAFGIKHRDITRIVRELECSGLIGDDDAVEGSYISPQNKVIPMYELTNNTAVAMIQNRRTFTSTPKKRAVALSILDDLGYSTKVVIARSPRKEDLFYGMLTEFFDDKLIVRQYPVGEHLIDFYIPDLAVFIEFDEGYHFTAKQKESDSNRHDSIVEILTYRFGGKPFVVRVKDGSEIQGLRLLSGVACLTDEKSLYSRVNEDTRLTITT